MKSAADTKSLEAYHVREATPEDIPAMEPMINAAFAVELSFKNAGRTTPEDLAAHFETGKFLLAVGGGGAVAGSVYVEFNGERGYLGMLAVDPKRQGAGIGRLLMDEAEERARRAGCRLMEIFVVNLRTELPPFYSRLGYVEVGTEPVHESLRKKATKPCHLIKMVKTL